MRARRGNRRTELLRSLGRRRPERRTRDRREGRRGRGRAGFRGARLAVLADGVDRVSALVEVTGLSRATVNRLLSPARGGPRRASRQGPLRRGRAGGVAAGGRGAPSGSLPYGAPFACSPRDHVPPDLRRNAREYVIRRNTGHHGHAHTSVSRTCTPCRPRAQPRCTAPLVNGFPHTQQARPLYCSHDSSHTGGTGMSRHGRTPVASAGTVMTRHRTRPNRAVPGTARTRTARTPGRTPARSPG
jgi:hypothetical protein